MPYKFRILFKLFKSLIVLVTSKLLCRASGTYCSRSRTAKRQRRAISVAGPATWNELSVTLRRIPVHRSISFLSALKTVMFDRGWARSASE